ncbi:MAG: alpha/beta hydrolase [Spirochaetia bacterium]|nr:alpha/beta hydrolase [Spirochaetia bacterium]
MPILDTRLGKISYTRAGRGKTMVFLHAAGHNQHDFDAVSNDLQRGFDVVVFDWPGHGESDMHPHPENVRAGDFVEVFEEVVRQFGLKDLILIGSSVGGYAAASYALRHPKNVRALVLVNSGGFNDPDLTTRLFCTMKGSVWVTRFLWNIFPAFYIKKRNPESLEILNGIRKRKNIKDFILNASIWRSFLSSDYDLRSSVRDIQCPTLLLWGRKDPVIRPEIGRKIQGIIPGSQFVPMETGHVPFAEDPAGFLGHLKTFLSSLP